MHEHSDCEHEIKYCSKCDVCYCPKCGKEWRYYTYTYTYPTQIITYEGTTLEFTNPVITHNCNPFDFVPHS